MPWGGFPSEKLALISKSNYSIRVKIALLADLALSNVAVKLDMITDLLIIIDSVKGTKGFIVFATTHVPYILDPALRRPGRFNETISIPLIPNLFSRWEILKTNLKHFIKPSFYSFKGLKKSFSKGITLDLTTHISTTQQILGATPWGGGPGYNLRNKKHNYGLSKGLRSPYYEYSGGHGEIYTVKGTYKAIIDPFQIKKNILFIITPWITGDGPYAQERHANLAPLSLGGAHKQLTPGGGLNGTCNPGGGAKVQTVGGIWQSHTPTGGGTLSGKVPHNIYKDWGTYFKQGEILYLIKIQLNIFLLFYRGYAPITFLNPNFLKKWPPHLYGALTGAPPATPALNGLQAKFSRIQNVQILLTVIARAYLSGSQIITSFPLNPSQKGGMSYGSAINPSNPSGVVGLKGGNAPSLGRANRHSFSIGPPPLGGESHKLMSSTDSLLLNSNIYLSLYASPETLKNYLTNLIAGKLGELFISSASGFVDKTQKLGIAPDSNNFKGNSGLLNLYGIDKSSTDSWTSLLFSIITKRYLSNKNLSISRLLYFSNYSALNDTPAFPTSNILLPLKRYENYRKTFYTQIFENKINFQGKTLQEILELHQQQRFVKRLYKLPLREFFRSEVINNKLTGFANSFITLSSVSPPSKENINCSTNINWYYRNRILNRHRNYLKNQWCNGQLTEHNIESTFLSDIDCRSQCIDSIGDIFIDFPDSEQFYNVQNRRWMLTSTSCKNWLSLEKTNYNSTINQYVFDCLVKAFHSLDQSREILDFYAFSSFHECMLKDLKEITTISLFKRFSRPL